MEWVDNWADTKNEQFENITISMPYIQVRDGQFRMQVSTQENDGVVHALGESLEILSQTSAVGDSLEFQFLGMAALFAGYCSISESKVERLQEKPNSIRSVEFRSESTALDSSTADGWRDPPNGDFS